MMSASTPADYQAPIIAYYSQWQGERTYVNPATVVRTLRQRRVPQNAHILDLGFGNGEIALAVARAFSAGMVQGLDLTERNVNLAASKARAQGVENVEFRVEDVEKWQPIPETYHAILAMQLMQFIADPDALIQQIFKALRPGGAFLFATPFLPTDADLRTCFLDIYKRVIPNSFQYRTEDAWYRCLFQTGFRRIYTAKAHWDPEKQPEAWRQAYHLVLKAHGVDYERARWATWGGLISARKPGPERA